MTNDILQSDIDLARRLLDASRPCEEIVAALGYRGINGPRAAQLVADLQAGKVVEPDKPITINLPLNPTSETRPSEQQQSRKAAPAELPEARHPSSRSRPRKKIGLPWFILLALAAATVSVAAFVLLTRKTHTTDSGDQSQSPAGQATVDSSASKQGTSILNAKAISLEVAPDGVRMCGKPVTREHFLPGVFKILGVPDRTNEVQNADQIIYAYDNCGLLVYSPKNSGHCSIVLHFDGSDGPAGTKKPFVGTFKVNKQAVPPDTDAASLASFKEVGLESPRSASGIFLARFGAVELVFGYLKTPQRLSLIEIDFK